jgi:hypothetical protein
VAGGCDKICALSSCRPSRSGTGTAALTLLCEEGEGAGKTVDGVRVAVSKPSTIAPEGIEYEGSAARAATRVFKLWRHAVWIYRRTAAQIIRGLNF